MMLITVHLRYSRLEQEFCCFVKEIGDSSMVFCVLEQDAMEWELELFGKVSLLGSNTDDGRDDKSNCSEFMVLSFSCVIFKN